VAKFQDCAATVLPERQIEEAMQQIAHLEELPTLKPVITSLTLADASA
jgi:hypothetical protein